MNYNQIAVGIIIGIIVGIIITPTVYGDRTNRLYRDGFMHTSMKEDIDNFRHMKMMRFHVDLF